MMVMVRMWVLVVVLWHTFNFPAKSGAGQPAPGGNGVRQARHERGRHRGSRARRRGLTASTARMAVVAAADPAVGRPEPYIGRYFRRQPPPWDTGAPHIGDGDHDAVEDTPDAMVGMRVLVVMLRHIGDSVATSGGCGGVGVGAAAEDAEGIEGAWGVVGVHALGAFEPADHQIG